MNRINIKAKLVFITDTNLQDAKTPAKRKIVRAHAARSKAADDQQFETRKRVKQQGRKRQRATSGVNTFPLSLDGLDTISIQDTGSSDSKDDSTSPDDLKSSNTSQDDQKLDLALEEDSINVIQSASSSSQALVLSPSISKSGWVAPFVPITKTGNAYIPLLIDHYLKNLAVDIPELDAGRVGSLRQRWFPMVITSSATFNIVLLTAASHYAIFNNLIAQTHVREILLYLKQQTLSAINQLIRESGNRPMSDAIIGAVAKMASYEAMFGSPELFHMHMTGLRNMIKVRGGLGALGLEGLLMRMVQWIDLNGAFILNTSVYFRSMEPLAGHIAVQPNPGGFLGHHEPSVGHVGL